MKKLLIILLLMILIVPTMAMAAPSPSLKSMVYCNPHIQFKQVTDLPDLDIEGYNIIELFQITLDKEYEKVLWHLIAVNPDFTAAISNEELIFLNTEVKNETDIIVDFTDIKPGTYLLYFLIPERATLTEG